MPGLMKIGDLPEVANPCQSKSARGDVFSGSVPATARDLSQMCRSQKYQSVFLSFISDGRRSRNIGPEGDDGGRQKRLRISWLRSLAVLCVVAGETPIIAFYAVLSRSSRFPVKKKLDSKILLSVVQLR